MKRRRRRRLLPFSFFLIFSSCPVNSSVRRNNNNKEAEEHVVLLAQNAPVMTPPSTIRKNGDASKPSKQRAIMEVASPNPNPVETELFFDWCRSVMGIQTLLEVQEFDYYDYFRVSMEYVEPEEGDENDDMEYDDDAFYSPSVEDVPMIKVRGLAATQNIAIGDVVISIPFHAMITVSTTIDHDPVLSQLLGPEARAEHGWEDAELPLLTVAMLYHLQLGQSSPLYHYLQILKSSPTMTETMPFLWDSNRLRRDATEGVARIARGIKRDIREMYKAVMMVLIKQHPTIFANDESSYYYSFENFQWAFALVNSRHWQLPVKELDDQQQQQQQVKRNVGDKEHGEHDVISPMIAVGVPPAETPTEEWVRELDEENVEENQAAEQQQQQQIQQQQPQEHSFLAPVADLLNFGPPCTRGSYNSETKRFELIATCAYRKGQEVTFWYSDDCEDAILANYGFTHPMVPRCKSRQDWMHQSELWKRHAEALETDLNEAYKQIDRLDAELKHTRAVLDQCGDCKLEKQQQQQHAKLEREIRNAESRYTRHARLGRQHEAGVRGGGDQSLSGSEDSRTRRRWRRSIKSSL